MRLSGQVREGYYPTPDLVAQMCREALVFPDAPFPALDPCAGEGRALRDVTLGTAAETYGLEVNPSRAERARRVLDHIGLGGAEAAKVSHGAFSLLWLNPPYDWQQHDTEGPVTTVREEHVFLTRHTLHLAVGGVLIYLVPEARMTDPATARFLTTHYDNLKAFRFPASEYERFKQAVVFGVRRATPQRDADAEKVLIAQADIGLPHLERGMLSGAYTVPVLPAAVPIFRGGRLDVREVAEWVVDSPLWASVRRRHDTLRRVGSGSLAIERPPLPLRMGHLALEVASGAMDGVVGTGPNRHVAKGVSRKITESEEEVVENEDGDEQTRIREKERFNIAVRVLTPRGEVLTLD